MQRNTSRPGLVTPESLRRRVARFNVFYRFLGLALLLGAAVGWVLTLVALGALAAILLRIPQFFDVREGLVDGLFWGIFFILLGLVAWIGFRREHGFLELPGLTESPLYQSHRGGGVGRFDMNAMNLRLELLLFAPMATRQGLQLLFGTPIRTSREVLEKAGRLYASLYGSDAWIPLTDDPVERAAAEILARFDLIRLSPARDGSVSIRIPSRSEFD